MVRTPAENARPSATEAAAKVQTKWEEKEARRDFSAVGGSHQQRSDWNDKLARSGDRQECMASCYPQTQAHNPVLICPPCWTCRVLKLGVLGAMHLGLRKLHHVFEKISSTNRNVIKSRDARMFKFCDF